MAQGGIDHPSYVTRQMFDMIAIAGANGTSAMISLPYQARLRKAVGVVKAAGTSSGAGNAVNIIYIGTSVQGFTGTALTTTTTTATLGSLTFGSSTVGSIGTTTDMDALLVTGGTLALKNGTDATGSAILMIEWYLDPLATWTGPPG